MAGEQGFCILFDPRKPPTNLTYVDIDEVMIVWILCRIRSLLKLKRMSRMKQLDLKNQL